MVHPGLTIAVVLTVAVGTAVYYLFANSIPERPHSYTPNDYREPINNTWTAPTPTPRSRASSRSGRRIKDDEKCSICWENLGVERKTLRCRHQFHIPCIRKWLESQSSCPNCRAHV